MSMYPDDNEISLYGKTTNWPGLKDGKFTNGDFSDPLVPPSFIPADTLNLILDNLQNLITSMGGTPDNATLTQLADIFAVAAEANKGIRRDPNGRAKVAAPAAADDIARKAEVDAETTARQEGDAAQTTALTDHAASRNHPVATPSLAGLMTAVDKQRLDGCYIIASNTGETSGYIKWSNGLIMQWGTLINLSVKVSEDYPINLLMSYKNEYFASCIATHVRAIPATVKINLSSISIAFGGTFDYYIYFDAYWFAVGF